MDMRLNTPKELNLYHKKIHQTIEHADQNIEKLELSEDEAIKEFARRLQHHSDTVKQWEERIKKLEQK